MIICKQHIDYHEKYIVTVIHAVKVITSDQGSEFNNNLDKKLMKMMNIDHRLTTPYHPQVNTWIVYTFVFN